MVQSSNATRLMRIQARPGSPVERRHYRYPENRWAQLDPDAIAPGIPPDASADLEVIDIGVAQSDDNEA
jgi:hypothetical protein